MPPLKWCGYCLSPALRIGNPHHAQELDRPRARLFAAHGEVLLQGFGELSPDRQHRIERGHRLLEHHGDVLAADLADFLIVQLEKVPALEANAAADDAAGRIGDQPQNRERADGFAASGLADDGDRLALTDIIADAVDRLDHTGRGEEVGLQIVYLEKPGHLAPLVIRQCTDGLSAVDLTRLPFRVLIFRIFWSQVKPILWY